MKNDTGKKMVSRGKEYDRNENRTSIHSESHGETTNKRRIKREEVLNFLSEGMKSRTELEEEFDAQKKESTARYQQLTKVLKQLEFENQILPKYEESDGRRVNYHLYNYVVVNKDVPSEVDRFLLDEMKRLVADILSSDAYILSEFEDRVVRTWTEYSTKVGDYVVDVDDKEVISGKGLVALAPNEDEDNSIVDESRYMANSLKKLITEEWGRNDAYRQFITLQRRCASLLRPTKWLEERRRFKLHRPWRANLRVTNEKLVFDPDLRMKAFKAVNHSRALPIETVSLEEWLTFYLGAIDALARSMTPKPPEKKSQVKV